jgi:hypothetical protein
LKSSTTFVLVLCAVAALALGALYWTLAPTAPDVDLATSKPTANGIYSVSIEPEQAPMRLNDVQSLLLTVKTASGAAVDDALISIDGGMPAHNHGLPTAPKATASLGDGRYRIEGVKFSMGGHWELRFAIAAAAGADAVTFNLML